MTKIDKAYLERIGEVLYDEKKVINYKTVSMMMGVHVNIAKQMLYHLHKTGKEQGKKIYATYYVSGMIPRHIISSLGKQAGETSEESLSQQPDLEAYLVAICKEQDLEDLKAKYSKIFSVHMYSLSTFPIESCDVLANLVEFPMRDNEGRTPVDFGPVTCLASQKLKSGSDSIRSTIPNDVSKSNGVKDSKPVETKSRTDANGTMKNNDSSVPQDKPKEDTPQETKTKLAKPAVQEKNGGRLKSMFATAASKPKNTTTKKAEEKEEPVAKDVGKKKSETQPATRVKDKETRKRKRIRDVLSSDSEDEKMSTDGEGSPEVPAPRKRIQIESDSDDDFKEKETTKKPIEQPLLQNDEKAAAVPGRKRTVKTISKTYVDKDGFLVTTKEQVMVSEDEDVPEDQKESKKSIVETEKPPINGSAKSTAQNPVGKSLKNQPAGKTKQVSLMSFFQKK